MTRPKSSIVGFGNLGTSIYAASKVRKLGTEFGSLAEQIETNQSLSMSTINNIQDLSIASMAGIYELSRQLDELSNASWAVLDHIKLVDRRDEVLGNLKLLLINIEEEIVNIRNLFLNYPEYATLMAEDMNTLLDKSGVDIEKFKRMPSTEDIKWAKKVLASVPQLEKDLFQKLGDM